MNGRTMVLTVLAALVWASGADAAVNIETVTIGNPGNVADDTGYGGVGYVYNIGKYEVTTTQYTEFLNAVAGVDSYGLYNPGMWSDHDGCGIERYTGSGTVGDPYEYRVAANLADRPVASVAWLDTVRFANWMHNGQTTGAQNSSTTEDGAYDLSGTHSYYNADGSINYTWGLTCAAMDITRKDEWKWALSSEDEWYKAAYHKNNGATGNYFDYPTGSDSEPDNKVDHGGNNATFYDNGYTIDDPPPYYTEVGAHANSESPYGTFDQGGNAIEYNEGKAYTYYRVSRGGGKGSSLPSYLSSEFRGSGEPYIKYGDVGFRVVQVPEPGTLALLVLGGLCLMVRIRCA